MRSLIWFPVTIACGILGLTLAAGVDSSGWEIPGSRLPSTIGGTLSRPGDPARDVINIELLTDLEAYEDPDYGFHLAIPAGWRKIIAADSVSDSSTADPTALEPGYAVGFESVQEDENDRFADYILVEILPGDESGVFATDGSQRRDIRIDGRAAWYDRLEVDESSTGLTDVDLVIYQAELSGVGYTVGLYAIGEPDRESIMAAAFEVMLQTFRIIRSPFNVT